MPTWNDLLQELTQKRLPNGAVDCDGVRRKYLLQAAHYTKRPIILYATKWTQADPNVPAHLVSISDEDIQGLMTVIQGLPGPDLDLIMHSPGGSPVAAEALVNYLRSKFEHIRVIVPQQAMSAAAMMACAADVIVMGKHSFLGPIDPQLLLNTPLGPRMVPAQAILDQFDLAVDQCSDPARLAAWLPMLNQYGPDLLVQCENALSLAETLAREWLAQYMFKSMPNGRRKARRIAKWLSSHGVFRTHSRHIPRQELVDRGLVVENLEDDQNQQDLLLSVFHATTHTFAMTGAVKLIENSIGRAYVKISAPVVLQQGSPGQTS